MDSPRYLDAVEHFERILAGLLPGERAVVKVEEASGKVKPTPPLPQFFKPSPSGKLTIDPSHGQQDADSLMFFQHFDASPGSDVLEVGANEEESASILAENGFKVVGIDLRTQEVKAHPNYLRIVGDFVKVAPLLKPESFDHAFSTSAIEHFGLSVYGHGERTEDYDCQALDWMHELLRPGGTCSITVPYGAAFREDPDWRIYCRKSLRERIVRRRFEVVEKIFFLSGPAVWLPDVDGIVKEGDADRYAGKDPHLTVFVKMVKS